MLAQFTFHDHVWAFPVNSGSSMEIIIVDSRYPGNLKFVAVCFFNVSTCMCTIKNKMAEVFLDTKGF